MRSIAAGELGLWPGPSEMVQLTAHSRLNVFGRRITVVIARVLVTLAVLGWAAALEAQTNQAGSACGAKAEQLAQLTLVTVQTGRLAPGETTCFGLLVEKGEFIRISIDINAGYLRARVLEPRQHDSLQATLVWSFFPSLPLAFEAPTAGLYVVELGIPAEVPFKEVPTFRVQVHERLSPKTQAARLEDLRHDPRTAWLRENAVPIRSIDPEDEDFSDLEFLSEELRGARMVLLGEGDHGGGSDLKAQTRLTKFLHQKMGFDVLAFEAGLFATAAAWRALHTDMNPREAFLKGVFGILGRSEEVGPLIDYVAASTRSDHPLELAGFDSQFTGTSPESVLTELREFLRQHGIESPFTDENSTPNRVLSGILEGRFAGRQEDLPNLADQAQSIQGLQVTAAQLERGEPSRERAFWAQVLRSAAVQIGLSLDDLRGSREKNSYGGSASYGRGRDRQMAANLIWLADAHYRGRKIIVWAHTSHIMRNPHHTTFGREQGFTMGHGLEEALGRETFAIAFTSYTGTTHWLTQPEGFDQDIVPDQHPSFEFEELMKAAGHELAYVNLREARARDEWLGGAFLARPLYLMPEQAVWSEVVDALFFIRTQEPRRKVAGLR